MPNNTQFAAHFEKATKSLLDGMANPAGPVFIDAQYSAQRAIQSAFAGAEKEAGHALAELISNVAKIYGFTVR